ncbi:hypothetical protein [Piscirickettsia litoralis]|uniref:CN hydrolase domain-containing protein n=1 Tax=Piscirickettsia litoralis TaxID=1891921 RepID=A0ABX2ZZ24_9GAMM|nr:hypothetical protein [Piscirickettsia litoralis]ODN41460.1 hypothetical protein BGC07_15165 [Piscirickettsia litoralis]
MSKIIKELAEQARKNHFVIAITGSVTIDGLRWQYEYTGYVLNVNDSKVKLDSLVPENRIYDIDLDKIKELKLILK